MLKNIKIYLELISFFITIDDRHVKQNYGFFFCILKSCCLSTAKIQNDICKRKDKKKHFLPNAKYLERLVNQIMLQVKLFKLEH